MQRASTEELFAEYLAIVNRAIAQNRDRVPYKQLFAGGKKLLGERTVAVEIYDDSTTLARFTLGLEDDRLAVIEPGEPGEPGAGEHDGKGTGERDGGPTWAWKMSYQHLENVVADPQPYIESPIKLDIDWLETRIKD
jgi:hypothetical protein